MNLVSRDTCRVTRLSSSARGAVAVVALDGMLATEIVDRHFVAAAGRPLSSFPIDRIVFGRWGASDDDGEEIVVCRTSDTSVELNCHGGIAAAQAIVDNLLADGAVEQPAESWAMRGAKDTIQAEAWLALSEARTERAAAILLDQHRGALRSTLERIADQLQTERTDDAAKAIATLMSRGQIGLHLTHAWRVVFAGPPNVGKSSLMNRLLGFERSIVFDQPGTTRDLLTAPTAFDGWSVELTDTAGLRESGDAIEAEGVSRATNYLSKSDLAVLVFDVTSDVGREQKDLMSQHPDAILVMNKCDLCSSTNDDDRFIQTSAVTGAGLEALIDEIVNRLISCDVRPGDAIPFTVRQIDALKSVQQLVQRGEFAQGVAELRNMLVGN